VGCRPARLGHSITRVKISERSTPMGAEIWYSEKIDFQDIMHF